MVDHGVCRICLEKSKSLKSLFGRQKKFILTDFIAEFTQVVITKNDGHSSKICEKCLEIFNTVYEMKVLCIESDRILKEQFPIDLEIKLENNSSMKQYLPEQMVIKTEKHIKPEQMIEETKTELVEEELELESYSPTNIEYLDEVEDEQILDEASLLVEVIEESHLSEDSNNSINSDWLPADENLKSKKKRWKPNKLYQCSYCGKVFKTSTNLKGHEMIHNQIRKHECEVCKKMFLMKCDLTKHLQIHKNERAYKCNVCFKGFNKLNTMKDHVRLVHSGDKTHMCTICDIGFPLKQQLISHNRTHTGEKPHQCHICEKKYSHKIDLKRHIMLHTGDKPFKCPHCDKTFTKKSNMDCHIPVHTGEKPYKCNICFKEFRQPCPYKKHMKVHNDAGEQPTVDDP
ncbi:unnamed protein product [Diamesa tonsa]